MAARREERGAVRSGHRSAHVKVVVLGALLAAGALAYGWAVRAGRPVPEPFSVPAADFGRDPAPIPDDEP